MRKQNKTAKQLIIMFVIVSFICFNTAEADMFKISSRTAPGDATAMDDTGGVLQVPYLISSKNIHRTALMIPVSGGYTYLYPHPLDPSYYQIAGTDRYIKDGEVYSYDEVRNTFQPTNEDIDSVMDPPPRRSVNLQKATEPPQPSQASDTPTSGVPSEPFTVSYQILEPDGNTETNTGTYSYLGGSPTGVSLDGAIFLGKSEGEGANNLAYVPQEDGSVRWYYFNDESKTWVPYILQDSFHPSSQLLTELPQTRPSPTNFESTFQIVPISSDVQNFPGSSGSADAPSFASVVTFDVDHDVYTYLAVVSPSGEVTYLPNPVLDPATGEVTGFMDENGQIVTDVENVNGVTYDDLVDEHALSPEQQNQLQQGQIYNTNIGKGRQTRNFMDFFDWRFEVNLDTLWDMLALDPGSIAVSQLFGLDIPLSDVHNWWAGIWGWGEDTSTQGWDYDNIGKFVYVATFADSNVAWCYDKISQFFTQDYPGHFTGGALNYIGGDRGTGYIPSNYPDIGAVASIFGVRYEYADADGNPFIMWDAPGNHAWFPEPDTDPLEAKGYMYRLLIYFVHPFSQVEVDEMSRGEKDDNGLDEHGNLTVYVKVKLADSSIKDAFSYKLVPGEEINEQFVIYKFSKANSICFAFDNYTIDTHTTFPRDCEPCTDCDSVALSKVGNITVKRYEDILTSPPPEEDFDSETYTGEPAAPGQGGTQGDSGNGDGGDGWS